MICWTATNFFREEIYNELITEHPKFLFLEIYLPFVTEGFAFCYTLFDTTVTLLQHPAGLSHALKEGSLKLPRLLKVEDLKMGKDSDAYLLAMSLTHCLTCLLKPKLMNLKKKKCDLFRDCDFKRKDR